MNRREKIIVGVAAVALIGAAADYALRGLFTGPVARAAEGAHMSFESVVGQTSQQLSALQLTPEQRRILDAAQRNWPNDPFVFKTAAERAEEDRVHVTADANLPVYYGSVAVGSTTIGIIDGLDYTEGDWLDNGSHRVLRILHDRVELLPRGGDESITIQLDHPKIQNEGGYYEEY